MTDNQPAALADHTENHLDMVGRWYMVNRDGMATLCEDQRDAEKEAKAADMDWPHSGPHRAARLEIESLRAGERTPQDYAIEHAEYLAQYAERLLDAINHLNAQCDEDGDAFDSDALARAEEAVTEAFSSVRSGIYEFRKRRDKTGRWGFTALQLSAATQALDAAEAIHDASTPMQMQQAMDAACRAILKQIREST